MSTTRLLRIICAFVFGYFISDTFVHQVFSTPAYSLAVAVVALAVYVGICFVDAYDDLR